MKEIASSMSQRSVIGFILTLFIIGLSAFMAGGKNLLFIPLISASALLIIFLYHSGFSRYSSVYIRNASLSFLLFIGFGLVSTFFASDLFLSIQGLISWCSYITVFFAGLILFNDSSIRKGLGWSTIIIGFVSAFFAVFDFVSNGGGSSRLAGLFFDSNIYGGFLVFPFFLAIAYLIKEKNTRLRIFLTGASGFLLAATFLTFSRGTWISVLVGTVCIFFLTLKGTYSKVTLISLLKQLTGVAVVTFVVASLVVVMQMGQGLSDKAATVRAYETSSENGITARFHYVGDALRVSEAHPLVGLGFGNYVFGLRVVNDDPAFFSINPHNVYVEILATLGIGGCLSLFYFIFVLCVFGYKKQKEIQNSEPLIIGSSVALIAFLSHMGVQADSSYPAVMTLFFLFAGIVFGQSTAPVQGDKSKYNTMFVVIILIAVTSVFSSVYIYFVRNAILDGEYYLSKGKFDDAVSQYNHALSLAPFDSSGYVGLAIAQERGASYEEDAQEKQNLLLSALSNAESAVRFSSENADALNVQARLLVSLGEYEKAKAVLLKSKAFDRCNIDASSLLIGLYMREGKVENVVSEINSLLPIYITYTKTAAFKSDPNKPKILQYIAAVASVQDRLQSEKK